jgi:hypothetical protein
MPSHGARVLHPLEAATFVPDGKHAEPHAQHTALDEPTWIAVATIVQVLSEVRGDGDAATHVNQRGR